MQLNEQTDSQLIDRVRSGDDAGFDELLRRYKQPVVSFVYRLLGNEADAVEVAQDAFVRAYQNLERFDAGKKFSTWLFALARNAAIDRLRWRDRHPIEELDVAHPAPVNVPSEVEAREIGRQVAAAVAELPEDQRTAIVLSEYQDLSYAEIAGVMRCSEKSVESRLYRAKQALRKRLAFLLRDA
jgi:RNA polymerase sigma factor (sigma-70 family)